MVMVFVSRIIPANWKLAAGRRRTAQPQQKAVRQMRFIFCLNYVGFNAKHVCARLSTVNSRRNPP
jgi:hypothetical protein